MRILQYEAGKKVIKNVDASEIDLPKVSPAEIKTERTLLLSKSDWTQLVDAPVVHEDWAVYRQALRDLPEQSGFPDDIVWPIQPV